MGDRESAAATKNAVASVVMAYSLTVAPAALDNWSIDPDPKTLEDSLRAWADIGRVGLDQLGISIADEVFNVGVIETPTRPVFRRVAARAQACAHQIERLGAAPGTDYRLGGRIALTTALELRVGIRRAHRLDEPLEQLHTAEGTRGYLDAVAVMLTQPDRPRTEQTGPLWMASRIKNSILHKMTTAALNRRYEIGKARQFRHPSGRVISDFPAPSPATASRTAIAGDNVIQMRPRSPKSQGGNLHR